MAEVVERNAFAELSWLGPWIRAIPSLRIRCIQSGDLNDAAGNNTAENNNQGGCAQY